jgi:predicted MFS family arabinose efflux permease
VADLLPEEQRTEGYGVMRVAINVAVAVGPAIGGFMALYSYFWVFMADAVMSTLTAGVVLLWLPETKPERQADEEEEKLGASLGSYFSVLQDATFMGFLLASILVMMVYGQMYSTLSVFLRDSHGLPPSAYGWLLSLNAALVVVTQFWVTRRTSKQPPLRMMVVASLFYLAGFGLYGFVGGFGLFALAMVLITVGEMIHLPVANTIAATLAPEQMRGRYMAVFSLSFMIPNAIAPYLAGIVMDDFNPFWVWYGAAILAGVSAVIFWGLRQGEKRVMDREIQKS